MSGRLHEIAFGGPLSARLAGSPSANLAIYWLGQAGFVIDIAGHRIVIDPYLSDSLADKYRGTRFPHDRMMPPPIAPDALTAVDFVLATHAHTDHMDPGTLPALLAANPNARLVVPRAVREQARLRSGVPEHRILFVDAGERIALADGLTLRVTRAAHENLERDEAGHYCFVGYLLESAAGRIWHSGDCVPFDGLVEEIAALRPDIALLPVNGRLPELSANGIAGNFTIEEAADLCRRAGIPAMIAHHYGLFAFNTVPPEVIDAAAEKSALPVIARAREAVALVWQAAPPTTPSP